MSDKSMLPRWSLAGVSALHAVVFGSVAWALPFATMRAPAIFSGTMAALHLGTAVLAARRHPSLGPWWRATSALALAYLAYVVWGLVSSGLYVASIYGGLGKGVGALLGVATLPVVLFTVPLAWWGLAATWLGKSDRQRADLLALLLVATALLNSGLAIRRAARGVELASGATIAGVEAGLEATAAATRALPAAKRRRALWTAAPAQCERPPAGTTTLLVAFTARGTGRTEIACLQRKEPRELVAALAELVRDGAENGAVAIDALVSTAPLGDGWLDASLAVRPGLDGVCQGRRCLTPWQLVGLDVFGHHAPLTGVPDAKVGVAPAELRRLLGGTGPLYRIVTRGWIVRPEGVAVRPRHPGKAEPLTRASLTAAGDAAKGYILRQQRRDGRFRYLVDPVTGRSRGEGFSVARQAGTTLALCELTPPSPARDKAVRASLAALAEIEHQLPHGRRGVLRYQPEPIYERVGPSALALAALLRCRPAVGRRRDALVARLGRTLLSQQRADGGFHHYLDLRTGEPAPRPGSLYADGQIVLALSLLEVLAGDGNDGLPSRHEVRGAVERAMQYFGRRYWDHFAGKLFYLEENWHCIAAAASLAHHRNDAYERLCLDYVAFRGRFVLGDEAPSELRGGFGVGILVPPHNTPTAGHGEALAAAIRVARARGLDTGAKERELSRVLAFLLRGQYRRDTCLWCAPRGRVYGGFPEHMASPLIRIDYVQHAWAALGHGAEVLRL